MLVRSAFQFEMVQKIILLGALSSHLRFNLAVQCFQFLHISLLGWPYNAQTFLAVRLWNLQYISVAWFCGLIVASTIWKWT